jgi:integrase
VASISTDPNGNRTVQFVGADRKRRSVRLGKVPMKAAEEVCRRVEALVAARITGTSWDNETAVWVRDLDVALARKLARVGLVGPRPGLTTLDPFIRGYITGRTDLKESTRISMGLARQRLVAFFDPATPLRNITVGDAKRWVVYLREHYAEATAARTLKRARQFFHAAKDDQLVTANPFDGIKPGSTENPARLFFVTTDATARLIEACPDADWRAIVALARFGGLRCPSEVLALTWADIDWERGRFLVRASKTAHHESRGLRWVPLFNELRPHLDQLFVQAEPGAVHVITRYRLSTQNLRTTFLKIILRAGLTPWPRLIQNLRASRETELAARFPLHVVTAWMGNTEAVAAKHYLSVRDEDFAAALQPTTGAVHIPVQQVAEGGRMGEKSEGRPSGIADVCIPSQTHATYIGGPGGTRTRTPCGTGF